MDLLEHAHNVGGMGIFQNRRCQIFFYRLSVGLFQNVYILYFYVVYLFAIQLVDFAYMFLACAHVDLNPVLQLK